MTKRPNRDDGLPSVEVASCTIAHAEVLARLHGACFDEPWSASSFIELLIMAGAFGFIALIEDEPVGFILARQADGEGEIVTLGVEPNYRRAGLARTLVRIAESKINSAGGCAMFLEVAATNQPAQSLYRGLGYQEVGRREGYYQSQGRATDALILKATLVDRPSS